MAVGNSFRMRARYIRSAKQSVKIVNEKLTSEFTAREMVDKMVLCMKSGYGGFHKKTRQTFFLADHGCPVAMLENKSE